MELWPISLIVAAFSALAPVAAAAQDAAPAAGAWSEGKLSAARLIAGGARSAGVEISLKGAAHTYWRNPGDSGAPPVFDFSASKNLASATPRFPAPRRVSEDGLEVFAYVGDVVLPIDVAPRDPAQPVDLALDLRYAACDRICVPVEAKLALRLPPGATTADPALTSALAALPKPIGADGPRVEIKPTTGSAKPTWTVRFEPPLDAAADLFSDAAEGWFFGTKRNSGGGFDLTLEQKPDGAPSSVDITLVVADDARALETTASLDVGGSKP